MHCSLSMLNQYSKCYYAIGLLLLYYKQNRNNIEMAFYIIMFNDMERACTIQDLLQEFGKLNYYL